MPIPNAYSCSHLDTHRKERYDSTPLSQSKNNLGNKQFIAGEGTAGQAGLKRIHRFTPALNGRTSWSCSDLERLQHNDYEDGVHQNMLDGAEKKLPNLSTPRMLPNENVVFPQNILCAEAALLPAESTSSHIDSFSEKHSHAATKKWWFFDINIVKNLVGKALLGCTTLGFTLVAVGTIAGFSIEQIMLIPLSFFVSASALTVCLAALSLFVLAISALTAFLYTAITKSSNLDKLLHKLINNLTIKKMFVAFVFAGYGATSVIFATITFFPAAIAASSMLGTMALTILGIGVTGTLLFFTWAFMLTGAKGLIILFKQRRL